ncbi:MAG: hypothetical protein Hyperionvirus4_44 [Hyperionvirus sp.]|uniref:Uncharacterized protein n=1 Tax=Hyperionvirus sp. TaxID=2487770 RepID=A0A3G5ACL0_9VIRU|nr:MAG: hypothetical protein Hyperionvirus4_44 [Hyperionvirus sp.]
MATRVSKRAINGACFAGGAIVTAAVLFYNYPEKFHKVWGRFDDKHKWNHIEIDKVDEKSYLVTGTQYKGTYRHGFYREFASHDGSIRSDTLLDAQTSALFRDGIFQREVFHGREFPKQTFKSLEEEMAKYPEIPPGADTPIEIDQ